MQMKVKRQVDLLHMADRRTASPPLQEPFILEQWRENRVVGKGIKVEFL